MEYTYTLEDLPQVADKILSKTAHKTLLFYGDMGVGKTTLIQELARKLGVDQTLSSPTFAIVNEYDFSDDRLFHFDFYRLENEEEALDIGVEDYLDSGHWNFIEWPQKIEHLLSGENTKIQLTKQQNGSRTVNMMPVK